MQETIAWLHVPMDFHRIKRKRLLRVLQTITQACRFMDYVTPIHLVRLFYQIISILRQEENCSVLTSNG